MRDTLSRHRRRCVVCTHRQRDDIEQNFLRWRSPEKLARDYGIADHSSIYRHVHATGLYALRQRTIHAALESILERSDRAHASDIDVVRAASAYAHIDHSGQWVDPPTQFILELSESSEVFADLPDAHPARFQQDKSNSQLRGLKNDTTH